MARFTYLVIFISGFIMPFLTGFLGLMILDQSVIFEAAGRISRGEIPYDDIFFPYGLVPSLIQAVIFKITGVSWFSYVLHAAIINGCFAIAVYDALKLLLPGGSKNVFITGALFAAWGFYPMTGTPFMDNHSFFFSFLAWWSCLAALERKKYYLLIFTFIFLAAGFYSKPNPLVFWIFPILLECWFYRAQLKPALKWVLAGMAAGLTLMLLPALVFPTHQFVYYTFTLPFGIGKSRMGGSFVTNFTATIKYFKILAVCTIPMLYFIFSGIGLKKTNGRLITRLSLMIFITIVTGVLTKNSFYNFTTPVFIIVFVIFDELISTQLNSSSGFRFRLFRKISFLLWILLFIGISILNFRREIDIRFSFADLNSFSEELGFFVKTPLERHTKNDMEKLKRYITEYNAIYTGDSQFLFSLSGKNNPLPITHLNDGTTYNSHDRERYSMLKKKIVDQMISYNTEIIIYDINWNANQDLVNFIDEFKGTRMASFGLISVYRLDREKLNQYNNKSK